MNRVKKLLTSFIIFAGVLGVASALGFNNGILTNPFEARAAEETTKITFSKTVTTNTSFSKVTNVSTDNDFFKLDFSYIKAGGKIGTIAAFSSITRSGDLPTFGIKSVTVDYDDDKGTRSGISLLTWYEKGDKIKRTYNGVYTTYLDSSGDTRQFVEGIKDNVPYNVEGNYFEILAGAFDVKIDSITVEFGCQSSTKVNKPAASNPTSWTFNSSCLVQDTYTGNHYLDICAQLTFANNASKFLSENITIYHDPDDGGSLKGEDLSIKEFYFSDESLYQNSTTLRVRIRIDIKDSKNTIPQHSNLYGTDDKEKGIFWPKLWCNGDNVGDIKVVYHFFATTPNSIGSRNDSKDYRYEIGWGSTGDDFYYRVENNYKFPCLRINSGW